MAAIATLKRQTQLPAQSTECADVFLKASQTLGYSLPQNQHDQLIARNAELAKVMGWCAETNNRNPFTNESVQKYKRKITHPYGDATRAVSILVDAGVVLGVCTAIAALLVAVGYYFGAPVDQPEAWRCMTFCASFTAVVWAICGLVITLSPNLRLTNHEWKMRALQNYQGIVPEFALQTAIDIQQAARESSESVHFMVCELVEREKPKPVDPFLVLRLGHIHDFYLEVWNEPKYKQDRIV